MECMRPPPAQSRLRPCGAPNPTLRFGVSSVARHLLCCPLYKPRPLTVPSGPIASVFECSVSGQKWPAGRGRLRAERWSARQQVPGSARRFSLVTTLVEGGRLWKVSSIVPRGVRTRGGDLCTGDLAVGHQLCEHLWRYAALDAAGAGAGARATGARVVAWCDLWVDKSGVGHNGASVRAEKARCRWQEHASAPQRYR